MSVATHGTSTAQAVHQNDTNDAARPSLLHIAERVINRPLMLHPSKLAIIQSVLAGRIGLSTAETASASIDANRFVGSYARDNGSYAMNKAQNGIAIIPIVGSLVNRGAWIGASSGLVSYEGISAQLRDAAADPSVKKIVLDIQSGGGEVAGVFQTAALVREISASKPIVAFINDMAASAAYLIASAASEIVVSNTSILGSIGVVMTHLDYSSQLKQEGISPTMIYAGAHKVDANPFGPLSDAIKADLQAEISSLYEQFVGAVAGYRSSKTSAEKVRATEARTYIGQDAIDIGLADKMASFDALIADLSAQSAQSLGPVMKGNTMTKAQDPAVEGTAGTPQVDAESVSSTARAEGATAERARIAGIIRSEHAAGREQQATVLALDTDMSVEQAGKVLAVSPKGAAAAGPDQRAAAEPGFGSTDQQASNGAVQASWDKAIAKINGK